MPARQLAGRCLQGRLGQLACYLHREDALTESADIIRHIVFMWCYGYCGLVSLSTSLTTINVS